MSITTAHGAQDASAPTRSTERGGSSRSETGSNHAMFLSDFAYLSSIGGLASGGVDREAASVSDGMQRTWFGGWLASHGFTVRLDAVGNQFGLLTLVDGAPYVLSGSHLDSQPTAGRFDGAYGVLASAHAAASVAADARAGLLEARCNLAVVNWFNEEGSRFAPSMMGSSVFTGRLPLDRALATTDSQGVSVQQALASIGALGDLDGLDVQSYAEIHIEQGKQLEAHGTPIGIVTGTWGARKYSVTVHGEQAHTGSTLMADRRDALLGAALLITRVRRLADEYPSGVLHTAVSTIEVVPNSPVVVAREVTCNLDLRSADPEVLAAAAAVLQVYCAELEKECGVRVQLSQTHSWDRNDYSEAGFPIAEAVADDLGLDHERLLTVAGHDSTNMKDVAPTIMLFVPSRDGTSHNEFEYTEDGDLIAGLDVLTGVLAQLCSGALLGVDVPSV